MPELNDRDLPQRMARIEQLLKDADRNAAAPERMRIQEIVEAVMDLHGTGIQRMVEVVVAHAGAAAVTALAKDELIASLLLLHGLHPTDFDTRVRQALDNVRPLLHSHGGDVELLATRGGIVRLRLKGSCHGCPTSAQTLANAIEDAIYALAPDVESIEVESTARLPIDDASGRLALPLLAAR